MDQIRVFVYGTLRIGGSRAMPRLFPAAIFIAKGTVRGRLYQLGDYPGLILDQNGGDVIGEVYQIDNEILEQLDEIEGFEISQPANSLYLRKEVNIKLIDNIDNNELLCWIYLPNGGVSQDNKLIVSGDWIEYFNS